MQNNLKVKTISKLLVLWRRATPTWNPSQRTRSKGFGSTLSDEKPQSSVQLARNAHPVDAIETLARYRPKSACPDLVSYPLGCISVTAMVVAGVDPHLKHLVAGAWPSRPPASMVWPQSLSLWPQSLSLTQDPSLSHPISLFLASILRLP